MLWSRRIERGRRKTVNAVALATALLAFTVRFFWTTRVQNPLQALYSDMGGYYSRAIDLLDGAIHGDPRVYAFFPWGTHALIAGELALVGRQNAIGIAIVQSIASTIPAVCVVYFTARVVTSRWWILLSGIIAALWQPSVVHASFFMSEVWFSAFLVPGTLYLLRYLDGGKGAFRAGACLAIATVVRPQVLLTFALVGAVVVLTSWRSKTTLRGWIRFFAPILVILGFSAVRFHEYTGRWGLVSENGAINRVFGATRLGRIEAYWSYHGEGYGAWFTPPAKSPVKAQDRVVFEGYIGEEAILDRIREEHYALENTRQHVRRMYRNTKMLLYRNIFPEDDFVANGRQPIRAKLQYAYRTILINLLPFAAFGVLAMLATKRRRVVGLLFAAHAVTLIVVAALYFAEARMRMPYDPFVIVAAVAGGSATYTLVQRGSRRALERLRGMS